MSDIQTENELDDSVYSEEFELEHALMVQYQGQQCSFCADGSLDYHHRDLDEALMYFKCYKCGNMLVELMEWL